MIASPMMGYVASAFLVPQIIDASGGQIRSLSAVNEVLGWLAPESVALLRASGVTRMLQPEDDGGFATHPGDFAEAVMSLARLDGSAGWVAAMIGIAGWELAMAPRRVRDEVWEADADSWVATTWEPSGMLQPVAGGYRLDGRWRALCAADHCDWVLLGTRLTHDHRQVRVLVPRSEVRFAPAAACEGLNGAGFKDIIVTDAVIPQYRVLDHRNLIDGTAAAHAGLRNPIYYIPLTTVIPLGICAAVIGMAQHLLSGYPMAADYTAAAARIESAGSVLLSIVSEYFFMVLDTEQIDDAVLAAGHRAQLHAVQDAVHTVDQIVARWGDDALLDDEYLQRCWRDLRTGHDWAVQALALAAQSMPPST